MKVENRRGKNLSRSLFFGSGFLYLLTAVVYNEFLVGWIYPSENLPGNMVKAIRAGQINLLITGLLFLLFAQYAVRTPSLKKFFRKKFVPLVLSILLLLFVPLSIMELALSPYAASRKRTSHFLKDEEMGWRLKPGAEYWSDGVHTRINRRGLRGPEIEYEKTPGTKRILFLGNSVTFGDALSFEQTFPCMIGRALEGRSPFTVAAINAGVDGYSPWQEAAYLSREGFKFDPDLVVICFTLDDVTEKFALKKFGGHTVGTQLENNVFSKSDAIRLKSGIVFFFKKIREYLESGLWDSRDVLNVDALIRHPERPDVREAWNVTLANLDGIFRCCGERGVPPLLVVFPVAPQLKNPESRSAPQKTIKRFALERGISVIDLLPRFAERMQANNKRPGDYFQDMIHLTPEGCSLVAAVLTDFIQKDGLLERKE